MADHSLFFTPSEFSQPGPGVVAEAVLPTPPPPTPPATRVSTTTVHTSPKRARIDPSVASGMLNPSPLAAAEELIESHISSLHKGIATLLLHHGREHLVLSQRLFFKQRAKIRIEKDDDFIPASARVKFKLQVVKETEELPEYLELQSKAAEIVKRHQEELKACCIDSINLDIKAIRAAINRHFCKSLHAVSSLFHIAQGLDVESTHHTVAALLNSHSDALLKHTGLPTNEFQSLYTTTLNVPVPVIQVEETPPTARIGEIKRTIESVFVLSWDKYLFTYRENQLALSLDKEAKATLLSAKTETATMEIDDEIPADRTQLNELIRKEASQLAKLFIKKEVSNQLRLKNGTGGPKTGASTKNKSPGRPQGNRSNSKDRTKDNSSSTPRTRQRAKQRGRKAADANNDSQSDKPKKRGSRSKQRSTRRQTGSDNRNSRS